MPNAPQRHNPRPSRMKRPPTDNRPSAARRGYDRQWRRVRAIQLAREPLCQDCKRAGRVTPASEVHHVVALRDGGARLDLDNLASLCGPCHRRVTARE